MGKPNYAPWNQFLRMMSQYGMRDILDRRSSERNMEYLSEQMKGMSERQKEASGLRIGEIGAQRDADLEVAKKKFVYSLLDKPDILRLRGQIGLLEDDGQDTTEMKGQLEKAISDYADSYFSSLGGGRSPKMIRGLMGGLEPKEIIEPVKEGGTRSRFEAQLPVDVYKAQTERMEAGTKAKETTEGPEKEKRKQAMEYINDTVKYLVDEGVRAEKMDWTNLFGAAKIRDPLSPELRGQTLYHLNKMRENLINGGYLSQGQFDFIAKAWNSAQTTKEGAIPSPETGRTPMEEKTIIDQVEQNKLNAIAEEIQKKTGLEISECLRLAKEFRQKMPGYATGQRYVRE